MARNFIAHAPQYRRSERLFGTKVAGSQRKTRNLGRISIVLSVVLGALLLGFTPMWLTSKAYKNQLDTVITTLRPSVLQNDLATATINAQQGRFEQARQQSSSFFDDLSREVTRDESSFDTAQFETLESILEQRDEIITLLARSDPKGADRLSALYFNFTQVKNSAAP
jgi:hypothetical protein